MSSKKGFTLLELLVVIAIITILASLLIPAGSSARERARSAKAQSQIAALEVALTAFHTDFGFYPTSQLDGSSPDYYVQSGAVAETNVPLIIEVLTGFSFSGGSRSVSTNPLCSPNPNWNGPYLDIDTDDVDSSGALVDPWNHPYHIECALDGDPTTTPPAHNVYSFDISSDGGANGQPITNY